MSKNRHRILPAIVAIALALLAFACSSSGDSDGTPSPTRTPRPTAIPTASPTPSPMPTPRWTDLATLALISEDDLPAGFVVKSDTLDADISDIRLALGSRVFRRELTATDLPGAAVAVAAETTVCIDQECADERISLNFYGGWVQVYGFGPFKLTGQQTALDTTFPTYGDASTALTVSGQGEIVAGQPNPITLHGVAIRYNTLVVTITAVGAGEGDTAELAAIVASVDERVRAALPSWPTPIGER